MTDDFRNEWGVRLKPVYRCPKCLVEHSPRRKCKVDPAWIQPKLKQQRDITVNRLIKELCNAVDQGRRSARRWSWQRVKTENKTPSAIRAAFREAKRTTLARTRNAKDRSK